VQATRTSRLNRSFDGRTTSSCAPG
jgi:hypothetical protein